MVTHDLYQYPIIDPKDLFREKKRGRKSQGRGVEVSPIGDDSIDVKQALIPLRADTSYHLPDSQ